eukprot:COSAG01_NODE_2642_length_7323_cov_13.197121_6_plen_132_part_00
MLKRNTIVSTRLLEVLETATHPLSAIQILNKLAEQNLRPNKSTVYRILDKLIAQNTLHAIVLKQGRTYYEMTKGKHHHHHHFFCEVCETLFCLSRCHVDTFNIDLSALLPNKKFKITQHDFNLYGRCDKCA